MRAAHAVMLAGQQSQVICGRDGAQIVTFDARGNPVEPMQSDGCRHCADCSLVPIAVLNPPLSEPHRPDAARTHAPIQAQSGTRAARVWLPSRGPPCPTEV